MNNKSILAYWWVDLIIDKIERGKGYQTFVDRYIRDLPDIKLGFPNENAALIHRKHSWEVQEDHKILFNPFIFLFIYSPSFHILGCESTSSPYMEYLGFGGGGVSGTSSLVTEYISPLNALK